MTDRTTARDRADGQGPPHDPEVAAAIRALYDAVPEDRRYDLRNPHPAHVVGVALNAARDDLAVARETLDEIRKLAERYTLVAVEDILRVLDAPANHCSECQEPLRDCCFVCPTGPHDYGCAAEREVDDHVAGELDAMRHGGVL